MISTFLFYGGLGVAALRVALGAIFIVHGWPKFKSPRQTAENFNKMGFVPGAFWGSLVAILEFLGGIAIALGFFTQTFAMFFVLEFSVIVLWKVFRRQPFVHDWELDLLILAALFVLLWNGGGAFSLDRILPPGW